jgi:hypothetical protein
MAGNHKEIEQILETVIRKHATTESWEWIKQKSLLLPGETGADQLNLTFSLVPRKMGKQLISVPAELEASLHSVCPGFSMQGWSLDRACRVWLLLKLDVSDATNYVRKIEQLFKTGEMNELVALYSALPLLAYPESWVFRCTEGIRSNIGNVLEAIMYENPYPALYLDEPSWNQMIMKAFFTDKNVDRITGLDQRANPQLANILFDYAHERWQAHRAINPQLWRLTGKFIDQSRLPDMQKLLEEGTPVEKKAAVLACSQSSYAPARELVLGAPEITRLVERQELTWKSLARDILHSSSN